MDDSLLCRAFLFLAQALRGGFGVERIVEVRNLQTAGRVGALPTRQLRRATLLAGQVVFFTYQHVH